jgi:hypothetical protein
MTADITTASKIATALHENDGNVTKAAESLDMPRTTFRRLRDANAGLIAGLLNEMAESGHAADEPETDEPADVETTDEASEIETPAAVEPDADEPVEIVTAGFITKGHTYEVLGGDPAARVCMTHNPALALYGDEECPGLPVKSHCDKPGCGPDGACCGHEDCGACNNDGHLDTAVPAKPAPASAGTAARKRAVAAALLAAAGDLIENWNDNLLGEQHTDVTADEARQYLSAWLNYLPGGVWDERLGERSGAGRRK